MSAATWSAGIGSVSSTAGPASLLPPSPSAVMPPSHADSSIRNGFGAASPSDDDDDDDDARPPAPLPAYAGSSSGVERVGDGIAR